MTKKELIEALKPFDDDLEILIDNWSDGDAWYGIQEVNLSLDEDYGKHIKIAIDL